MWFLYLFLTCKIVHKFNLIKPIIFPKNLKSSYAGKFFVRESAETKNYDDLEKILDHLYFRLISSEEEK